MAVCPNCMNPFPPGQEPDVCPRCGTVLKPDAVRESVEEEKTIETEEQPQEESPKLSKIEKKKLKKAKRAKRKQAFKAKTAKLNPTKFRAPKIKKIRDPTVMVKQARARFFMIIAGFMITIMVFVHIFRNINRYVNKFTGGKKKHTEAPAEQKAANRTAETGETFSAGDNRQSESGNTGTQQGDTIGTSSQGTASGVASSNTGLSGSAAAPSGSSASNASSGTEAGSGDSSTASTSIGQGGTASTSTGSSTAPKGPPPVSGDTEKLLKRGKILFYKQQYQSCIDLMDQILLREPDNFEAQNYKNMATQALKARRERGQL